MKFLLLSLLTCLFLLGCGAQTITNRVPEPPPLDPPELPATAVFIGDSLVAGWGSLKVPFPERSYVNKGISGDTSAGMLARFATDVVAAKPEVVVIWGGGNGLSTTSMPTIEANLKAMREQAAAAGINVVFISLSPHRTPLEGANPTAIQLNAWIKSYAESTGAGYIDLWPTLAGSDGMLIADYAVDGVHLNAAGYSAITPIVKATLLYLPK